MGNPFIHRDHGTKEQDADSSLLLLGQFHSSDITDVQNLSMPGHAARKYSRDKHDEADLLIVPLAISDSHRSQTDEVIDTPIVVQQPCERVYSGPQNVPQYERSSEGQAAPSADDRSVGRDAPPAASGYAGSRAEQSQSADGSEQGSEARTYQGPVSRTEQEPVARPEQAPDAQSVQPPAEDDIVTAPRIGRTRANDYFEQPQVIMQHSEHHANETDNGGSLALGFFNGDHATSFDNRSVRRGGQYAEKTVKTTDDQFNAAWVLPAYTLSKTDTTTFTSSDIPYNGPCLTDNNRPYFQK